MLTILAILAIWTALSIPLSLVLGVSLRRGRGVELLGMDGDVAVYRSADGGIVRQRLIDRTAA